MRKAAALNWVVYRATGFLRQPVRSPRWRVGIYKVDRLGDFVLGLEAIRAISDIAGEENCVLFHGAASSQLARREFPNLARVEVPSLDGKLWVTRKRLRALISQQMASGGVDQLLCLRHFRALFDEVALQMIPASEVWCVRNARSFALDYELVRRRFEGDVRVDRPTPEANSEICEDLRCHEQLLRAWAGMRFSGGDLRPQMSAPSLARKKLLVLAPFGSDRLRELPPESVATCVNHARLTLGLGSVLLSPPDSIPRYEAYARRLAERGALASVQVTRTSDDLVDAIAASAAVLTTETATAHIATALDHPMVCLLGGGHHGHFAPWRRSDRQVWATHPLPCFNCDWKCIHPEPYCITRVTGENLIQALGQALEAHAVVPSTFSA